MALQRCSLTRRAPPCPHLTWWQALPPWQAWTQASRRIMWPVSGSFYSNSLSHPVPFPFSFPRGRTPHPQAPSCSGTRWGGCRRRSAALKPPTLWRRQERNYETRRLFTFLILSQLGLLHFSTVGGETSNRDKCKIILWSILPVACQYTAVYCRSLVTMLFGCPCL